MSKQGYVVYEEAQAQELDQAKLILMMYAGGINFLNRALKLAKTDKLKEVDGLLYRVMRVRPKFKTDGIVK